MGGFLSKLFGVPASDATRKVGRKTKAGGAKTGSRTEQIRQMQQSVDAAMTPERRALIESALKIRRSKAKILDDLGDEQKRQLYALAIKNMIGQDSDAEK